MKSVNISKRILCVFFIFFMLHQLAFSKNRGIINGGGICWISSALQSLSCVTLLNKFFYSHEADFKLNSQAQLYIDFLKKLQAPGDEPIGPIGGHFRDCFDSSNDSMTAIMTVFDRENIKKSISSEHKSDAIMQEYDRLFCEIKTTSVTCSKAADHNRVYSGSFPCFRFCMEPLFEQQMNKTFDVNIATYDFGPHTHVFNYEITYIPPIIHVRIQNNMVPVPFPLKGLKLRNRRYILKGFAVNIGGHWIAYGLESGLLGHWYKYDDASVVGPVDDEVKGLADGVTGSKWGKDLLYEAEFFNIKLEQLRDSLLSLKDKLGVLSGKLHNLKKAIN